MKVIPKNINKMKQIKELYLNSNGIKVLPEELFELTELNTLDLGVNSIKEIPDGIKKLSKLKVLLLNSNFSPPISLRNLYNNFKNMPHLQKLHLWSCQTMMGIPEEIVEWKSLTDFDIDNNKDSILPNSIKVMAWLKRLRISNKSISEKELKEIVDSLKGIKVVV